MQKAKNASGETLWEYEVVTVKWGREKGGEKERGVL